MRFAKYHGIGNDFVVLTDLEGRWGPAGSLPSELVTALCDRHTGVGGDGVIRVLGPDPHEGAVLVMDYYNADGGPAEMCGNGIRCLAVCALKPGLVGPGEHAVRTGAGIVRVRLDGSPRVEVDMGTPSLERSAVPMSGSGSALRVGIELTDGTTVEGTGVSMGNPHFVMFVDDLGHELGDALVRDLGPRLERHAAFPKRTNVEFVDVVSPDQIRLRVWERGVGETLACGSGACAAAVASSALDRTGRVVHVELPGGSLDVSWRPDGRVWMSGPAEEVLTGEVARAWLEARGLAALRDLVAR